MKKTSLKAFTLIEIMIVVVIIGILAVALFPKLLGAIGKTSDEARKSELKNLTAILLQYKNDHAGSFEGAQEGCLNASSGFGKKLVEEKYITESKFPKDPNKSTKVGSCSGDFYFKPLRAFGVDNNAFMVVAKVENAAKGNATNYTFNADAETFQPQNCSNSANCYYVEVGGF